MPEFVTISDSFDSSGLRCGLLTQNRNTAIAECTGLPIKQTGTLNLHMELPDLIWNYFYSQTHSYVQEFHTALEDAISISADIGGKV